MPEADSPGILDRLRTRYAWFEHVMKAQERYREAKGDFFAAGITYFTVFALFPLLMVSFSVAGFVLIAEPQLLDRIDGMVRRAGGEYGGQISELIDAALSSRTSVGIIGLATALFAGLGWMANLREALSEMWAQRNEPAGFVRTKLSDLLALGSLFVALLITLTLTALSSPGLMKTVLGWFGLAEVAGLGVTLQAASLVAALGTSWLLFTWVIARLPRESVSFHSAARAGLMAAVGFEIFKQLGSIYLQIVARGPAGVTFGPIIGFLVFGYITARLLLFATAWAATAAENLAAAPVPPPGPAVIAAKVRPKEGITLGGIALAVTTGALGALGLSRLLRR